MVSGWFPSFTSPLLYKENLKQGSGFGHWLSHRAVQKPHQYVKFCDWPQWCASYVRKVCPHQVWQSLPILVDLTKWNRGGCSSSSYCAGTFDQILHFLSLPTSGSEREVETEKWGAGDCRAGAAAAGEKDLLVLLSLKTRSGVAPRSEHVEISFTM